MPDSDHDGLSDEMEAGLGTDPHERDSDHDGLSDLREMPPMAPATGWRAATRLAAGPLHSAGLQRLLGAPECDRQTG